MQSWINYQNAKRDEEQAVEILGYIGQREPYTTAQSLGYVHNITVTMLVHFQPRDGAKNYHKHEALDSALSEAAKEMLPDLMARAKVILARKTRDRLIDCKIELQAALDKIAAYEAA